MDTGKSQSWIEIPALPLTSCMITGKLFNLFMSQFPQLENGTNDAYFAEIYKDKTKYVKWMTNRINKFQIQMDP